MFRKAKIISAVQFRSKVHTVSAWLQPHSWIEPHGMWKVLFLGVFLNKPPLFGLKVHFFKGFFELNPTQKSILKNTTPGLLSSGYGNILKIYDSRNEQLAFRSFNFYVYKYLYVLSLRFEVIRPYICLFPSTNHPILLYFKCILYV